MALESRERRELVSTSLEYLQNVIAASGRAEELVKLTTKIVQNTKKLLTDGIPEDLRTKTTATLAEFVMAAKIIAKDARAVDSSSLQQLSSTKRAVEAVVKELDQWHSSESPTKDSVEVTLEELVHESRRSPDSSPISEREKSLLDELKRKQRYLLKKKDPQSVPEQHGSDPEMVLDTAVGGLTRSVNKLAEQAGQKNPSKEVLLEPAIHMIKMVCMLMDLVDSLFVSKYPMRTQVHSFCCTLVENILAYRDQPKSEDAASLRIIATQSPALLNAVEVMVEQCSKRVRDVETSKDQSILRGEGLRELDRFGPGVSPRNSPMVRRRKTDKNIEKEKVEFEIRCMICTSMAVNAKTKEPIAKGSELTMKASPHTKMKDVRAQLSSLTGLPIDHIQLKFQGDDDLPDQAKVTPNNPVPYFMFNLHEPNEDVIREIKKEQRRKNRLTIMHMDLSRLSMMAGPMAVAMYDYEALGEDGNLEFDEGDIIEIIEKSADGWWTGKLDDKTGVFPASFVEEFQRPQTKDEAKKLAKKFKRGELPRLAEAQTETITFDDTEETHIEPSHGSRLQIMASGNHTGDKTSSKGLRRSSEEVPRRLPKFERNPSEPVFSQFQQHGSNEGKQKGGKRLTALFKKRPTTSLYTPILEDRSSSDLPKPRSPILTSPTGKKKPVSEFGNTNAPLVSNGTSRLSPDPARKPLVRPMSSPRIVPKSAPKPASPNPGVKRRPPPPRPPPYAATHKGKGLNVLVQKQQSEERSDIGPSPMTVDSIQESPPPPRNQSPPISFVAVSAPEEKKEVKEPSPPPVTNGMAASNSMEELLKNLEEFDVSHDILGNQNGEKENKGKRDYATIPRSELPERKRSSESETTAEDSMSPPLVPPVINISEMDTVPVVPTKPEPPAKPQSVSKPKVPSKPDIPAKPKLPPKPPVENGLDREGSPQPIPPPRIKKGRLTKKSNESSVPTRHAPPPPPPSKPKDDRKSKRMSRLEAVEKIQPSSAPVSRTASPEEPNASSLSREGSASTDRLEGSIYPSRSPVVMRRKNTVVTSSTPEPPFSDEELEECTGIGKEGILYKEGTTFRDHSWKARHFRLLNDKILYFTTDSYSEEAKPLGQVLVNRMEGAAPLGERDDFQCFAIHMRYDTSVVLGAHTKTEMIDWVKSINRMIKASKSNRTKVGGGKKQYGPSYKTAVKCITYLSEGQRTAVDRAFVSGGGNMGRINKWLDCIGEGEDPDLSDMPDALTAVALLKLLFKDGRLGTLIPHHTARDLCDLVKSTSPVSVLGTKLGQLPSDSRGLLKQLLRLFGQVLECSHKNHTDVGDLNKVFGPVIFERVAAVQSEPLLAYLISTCELIIS